MKEYTIMSLVSIFTVILLDKLLKTNLTSKKIFWKFQAVIILLTTIVDSFSSGKPIVIFNPDAITNIRFFSVPIENYFFGFSLITLNLILFEIHNKKYAKK